MQTMIPAMPAPKIAETPATSSASAPARIGREEPSFHEHLDQAENRLEKTGHGRPEKAGRGEHRRPEKKTAGSDTDQNTETRPTADGQATVARQQTDAAPDQQTAAAQARDNWGLLSHDLAAGVVRETLSPALTVSQAESSAQGSMLRQTAQEQEQILTPLLEQVTGDRVSSVTDGNMARQRPAAGSSEDTGQLIVEQWQARFTYEERGSVPEPKSPQAESTPLAKGIEVQLTPELTEQAGPARSTSGTVLEGAQQPRDTTANYIHSNLPGVVTTETDKDSTATMQQEDQGSGRDAEKNSPSQPQPARLQSPDTPLIFSLDQAGTQGTGLSGQQAVSEATLRLPSGTEVPHSQVVNQVTDHFSLNRNLESGSVILRLHPAELGELRMEIKVEQDNIKAHITTHNPQVQDILDRNIPRLREVLEQQGMNLEHIQVSVAADDSGNDQFFQEQFEQQQFNRNTGRRAHQVNFTSTQEEEMNLSALTQDEQSLSVHA